MPTPFSCRRWLCALPLLGPLLLLAGDTHAGLNPHFTIPLHAKSSSFEVCDGYLPVDCVSTRPTVNAIAGEPTVVYVMLHNFVAIGGIQTAFEWDPSWNLVYGLWDCQPGSFDGSDPQNPGGPIAGVLSKAFVCVTGPALAVVGRMFFVGVESGCIQQVQPSHPGLPDGIAAIDCNIAIDQITDSPADEGRLGRICVGSGGHDACDRVLPVEGATWGRVKATYGR
jgi:hypothetical protein